MNIDTARSYATEALLEKGLARLRLELLPHLTVRNREGRWTAVFPYSVLVDIPPVAVANHGFMVLG